MRTGTHLALPGETADRLVGAPRSTAQGPSSPVRFSRAARALPSRSCDAPTLARDLQQCASAMKNNRLVGQSLHRMCANCLQLLCGSFRSDTTYGNRGGASGCVWTCTLQPAAHSGRRTRAHAPATPAASRSTGARVHSSSSCFLVSLIVARQICATFCLILVTVPTVARNPHH